MGHAGRGKSTAQVEEDSFCTYSLSSSFGCEYAKSRVKQPQDTLYDDLQGASAETQDGGKRGPKKKKNTALKQGDGRPLLSYAATRSAQSVHKHTPNSGLVSQTGFTQKRKKKEKDLLGKRRRLHGCLGGFEEENNSNPPQDQNAS